MQWFFCKFELTRPAWLAALVLGALLLAAPVAWAQEQEEVTVQVAQVDTSRFPEIDVYVSATDPEGQPVTTLAPDDFRLTENGQAPGTVEVTQAGEHGHVGTGCHR